MYASVLKLFIEYCEKNHKDLSKIDLNGIVVTSESITEDARSRASKMFNCTVLSRYSSLETGIIAHQCPDGSSFHVNRANYHVELLDLNSNKPAEENEFGRVVVTDLYSYGMPLIRYDIGDIAKWSIKECPCGRKGPSFSEIGGRLTDNLIDDKGELISWGVVNTIIWKYEEIKDI